MGFLNNWLSGCPHTPNLADGFLMLVARLLNNFLAFVLRIVWVVLRQTLLSSHGDQTVMRDVQTATHSLDAVAFALLIALLLWAVLANGERLITQGQWDGWQGLAGRVGAAVLWIAGSAFAVQLLLHVNSAIVAGIGDTFAIQRHVFAVSCSANGALDTLFGSGAAYIGVIALGAQGLLLVFVLGLFWALAQWLSRLAEIFFWGSLLPVAAATIVADSSRSIFTYVWRNIQGAIFTQSAMALGLWLIFGLVLHHQNLGSNLLSFCIAIAGLFLVARIPAYFQQALGHSTSGGFDMARGAGAILMARGAGAMLTATPAGQFMERAVGSMAATSDWRLNTEHRSLPGSRLMRGWYHRMGINMSRSQAVNDFQARRYAAAGGALALERAGERLEEAYDTAYAADEASRIPLHKPPAVSSPPDPGSPPPKPGGPPSPAPAPARATTAGRVPTQGPAAARSGAGGPWAQQASGLWVPTGYAAAAAEPTASAPPLLGRPAETGAAQPSTLAGGVAAASAEPSGLATGAANAATGGDKTDTISAEEFVRMQTPALARYLRDYVMPMTIARHAFDPLGQMDALARLKADRAALDGSDPQKAVNTFAKLTGVTAADLGESKVQARISQELAAKQWAGNVAQGHPTTITANAESPLTNTAVRSIHPDRVAVNFGAPPARVVRYVHDTYHALTGGRPARPTPPGGENDG